MKTIPRFSLYGNDTAAPAWHHLVDFEHIPERSGRFHWEISPHVHDVLLQVLYITRGGGEATIEGRTWSLAPPCLVLVPAGSVHAFSFRPDVDGPVVTAAQRPLEAMARQLAPELLPLLRQSGVLRVDPLGAPARALPPLFAALEREVRGDAVEADGARVTSAAGGGSRGAASGAPEGASADAPDGGSDGGSDGRSNGGYIATVGGGFGSAAAALALLTAVLVQAARVSAVQAATEGDPYSRKVQQVERFKALVEAHFRTRWPVARYAAALNVSAGQLGRLTREVLGCSPLDAVNERIVREAQRELVHASAGVKQVAAALGFEDDAYFGRFFKKHTGLRPGEFRQAGRRQVGQVE